MKKYLEINPVANQYIKGDAIFESQKTDSLLQNGVIMFCDCLYNCVYAYAPKRDRNLDSVRAKFNGITSAKNLKSSLAQAIEFAEDNDLSSPMFSEPRRLSIESMQKFSDALLRSTEIDNNNTKFILKQLKDCLMSIIQSISEIEEGKSMIKESFGFSEKAKDLRDHVQSLLVKSDGKDGSKGFQKNWKNIFTALDQKIKSLSERPGISERDYAMLDNLKKEVSKYSKNFGQSIVDSFDKVKNGIESDESYEKYGDVISGLKKATEIYNRSIASEDNVREELEDRKLGKEENVVSSIFPIKLGESDESPKFKGKKVITIIQDSLSEVPEFASFLSGDKKGIFGKNTKVVIQTIQKQTGNNNPNGEIDQSLYSALKNSDWINNEQRMLMDQTIVDIIKEKKN